MMLKCFYVLILFFFINLDQSQVGSTPISESINISGFLKILNGNQMPSLNIIKQRNENVSGQKIIAVKGRVKANPRESSVPYDSLSSIAIEAYTNKKGLFDFHLKSGVYTFFIVKDNKAYLNSFDGNGYFKATTIDLYTDKLEIVDDSKLIY